MATSGFQTSVQALQNLPTSARPKVDARDVAVPEGYRVEPVIVGLNFPIGLDFAPDGTLFLSEGGSTWPPRPYMPSRLLAIDPSGDVRVLGTEPLAGLRGVAYHDGAVYATAKGGYRSRIVKYDVDTGERTVVVDTMPNGGWHEPGGPVFGADGLMYFGQGSISQQGVVLPPGFTVDMAKHPKAYDIPGEDVTLTGNNVWSRDSTAPYPYYVETGPFKPFGEPAKKGEVVKGDLWCTTGVWRTRPDGSDPELLAWGIRNPFGLALSEDGDLYVSDNDFEEKGERSVANDPDRIWHVKNARRPHGSVERPEWFGFPDLAADGLPVWHEKHRPNRGKPAEPLLENPPPFAGPAAVLFDPHTGMGKMDFCRSDAFGHRGDLFTCLWGTMAPLNSTRPEDLDNGFQVARVDLDEGTAEPFMRNRHPGPASAEAGSGGLERPVDCKFSPDGKSLYVADFGHATVTPTHMTAFAHTGVLWRVTRE